MRTTSFVQNKPGLLEALVSVLSRLAGTAKNIHRRRTPRLMRICETLSLGDRRNLALVCVENEKLLLGTAGNSITLLARFPEKQPQGSESAEDDPVHWEEAFDAGEYKQWR